MEAKVVSQEIAGFMGRLLRDSLGRGPRSVSVSLGQSIIIIYLQGFMSPFEEILVDEGQHHVVMGTRQTLMKRLLPTIKAELAAIPSLEMVEFYYDWSVENRSGVIVAVTKDMNAFGALDAVSESENSILHEVYDVHQSVQGSQGENVAYRLDTQIFIVVCTDVLAPVEQELIRLGNEELLKTAKRNVVKSYLKHSTKLLGISDIFVDWDFSSGKSVTVLKFK